MDLFIRIYRLWIVRFIKKWKLVNIILGAIDLLAIALAFQLAHAINLHFFADKELLFFKNKDLLTLFLIILPVWLLVLYLMDVTEIPRSKRYRTLFFEYMLSALSVTAILLIFYFVFRDFNISRRLLAEFTFLGFLLLFLVRMGEYVIFKTYRAKGFNYLNIAVIADDSSSHFIEKLGAFPEWGYHIKVLFTNSGKLNEKYRGVFGIMPFRSTDILNNMIANDVIDEVFYLKEKINPAEVRNTIRLCERFGVVFRLLIKERQPGMTNAFFEIIGDERFLTFSNVPHNIFALTLKKSLDITISIILLVLLSPLMLFIALSILFTSRGPVIYSQERVGLRGRLFKMYKFRTMYQDAEKDKRELEPYNEMDGPVFKLKDDPRITRVGRFYRQTGLDELPQLINVLKGEMSLIGPRPPVKEETLNYKQWQLRRLSVKPGLSCFWQVKPLRNTIKFEKWMEMDLAYIDNWSLRLDFLILIRTIKTVFLRSGV